MEKKLISVIIPVYNVEKYVERCIKSILKQTYHNIEVIVVNDGSTDNSGMICKKIIKGDKRCVYKEKQNGGLSDARNFGVELATGKYVTFIDSDDYVEADYIENLYSCFLSHPDIDMAICGAINIDEDGEKITELIFPDGKYDKKTALKGLLYANKFECYAWGKLYKREIFEKYLFTVNRLFEDIDIMYKILMDVNSVYVIRYAGYYYVQRNNSITQQEFNYRQLDLIDIFNDMERILLTQYPDLENAVNRRKSFSYIWLISKMMISSNPDIKLAKSIKKEINKFGQKVIIDRESSIKDKAKIILLNVLGVKLFSKLYTK